MRLLGQAEGTPRRATDRGSDDSDHSKAWKVSSESRRAAIVIEWYSVFRDAVYRLWLKVLFSFRYGRKRGPRGVALAHCPAPGRFRTGITVPVPKAAG